MSNRKILISLPPSVIEQADIAAREKGVTRSALILTVLVTALQMSPSDIAAGVGGADAEPVANPMPVANPKRVKPKRTKKVKRAAKTRNTRGVSKPKSKSKPGIKKVKSKKRRK
jgi:cell division septation protein DedD